MRGKFITFEGGEGAGKTTQIAILADRLRAAGRRVVLTRETGGTVAAEDIRRIVKSREGALDPVTEMLLVTAARRDHILKLIVPKLESGADVVCDRYLHSTLAYQGGTDAEAWKAILADHARHCLDLFPDIALLLDVPAEASACRLTGRGLDHGDAFDTRGEAFHRAVRAAYLLLADGGVGNLVAVDGVGSVDAVAARIAAVPFVASLIGNR